MEAVNFPEDTRVISTSSKSWLLSLNHGQPVKLGLTEVRSGCLKKRDVTLMRGMICPVLAMHNTGFIRRTKNGKDWEGISSPCYHLQAFCGCTVVLDVPTPTPWLLFDCHSPALPTGSREQSWHCHTPAPVHLSPSEDLRCWLFSTMSLWASLFPHWQSPLCHLLRDRASSFSLVSSSPICTWRIHYSILSVCQTSL